jgi:serine/threonine protein kinase
MTGVGRLPTDSSSSRSYDLIGNLPPSIVSRPEILLEGYHATSQQWLEIPFRYKPDQVNRPPPVNFPHQPRLDWQMWFAALGSYEHNPWLVHLIYKLLQGDSIEVISLLDLERYPFAPSPSHKERPKMIRATLYEMDFTRFNTTWSRNIPLAEILEDNGISLRPYQTLDELETECEIMTESGMMATVRVSQLICSVVFKARRVFEEYSVWNVLWTVLALIGLTEWYSFLKAKRRDQ